MVWQHILRRLTAQSQDQLIQKLSETEVMMKAAEKAHSVVQRVQGSVTQIGTKMNNDHDQPSSTPSSQASSPSSSQSQPHHTQDFANNNSKNSSRPPHLDDDYPPLYPEEDDSFIQRLKKAQKEIADDAAADWQDIKSKFSFRKKQ